MALHPNRRLPRGILLVLLVLSILFVGISVSAFLTRNSVHSAYAVASTPPPPPTFLPTPIGPPPPPPTTAATVTPTSAATATPAGTATPGGTAAPTPSPTATAKPTVETGYSLDAARVSKVGNPGNLRGLVAVRRGSKVWLMMYYSINRAHKRLTRTTTYDVRYRGTSIFRIVYRSNEKQNDRGRFSRYTVYSVPQALPFGKYYLHVTLQLGSFQATRSWGFTVGAHERSAASVR